jgi:hypothetical protein
MLARVPLWALPYLTSGSDPYLSDGEKISIISFVESVYEYFGLDLEDPVFVTVQPVTAYLDPSGIPYTLEESFSRGGGAFGGDDDVVVDCYVQVVSEEGKVVGI